MAPINIRVRTFISTGNVLPDPQTWSETFTEEDLRIALANVDPEDLDTINTWRILCCVVRKAFELKGYDVDSRTLMIIKSEPVLIKVGKAVGIDYAAKVKAQSNRYAANNSRHHIRFYC